jgi:hypothetical protein
MTDRIPVKAIYTGTDVTSLGELASGDTINGSYITDDTIDEARLQISNAGTNGQFLSKQASGLTWASSSGSSAWEWVETIQPAAGLGNNARIWLCNQNVALGYDYLITWEDIKASGDASLVMRLGSGSTPSELSSNYAGTGFYAYGSTAGAQAEAADEIHLHRQNQNGGGDVNDVKFGEMLLYNPAGNYPTWMHGIGGEYNGSLFYTTLNSCIHDQSVSITAFGVQISGSTFSNNGNFITYRRKKS